MGRSVYRGGSAASMPRLTWDYTDYYPTRLESFNEAELRKEYTRLRDIAQKRLKRIEASEFRESETVRYNAGRFLPLKAVESKRELSRLLVDVVDFLTAKRGSLGGMRAAKKAALHTLHTAVRTPTYQREALTFVNTDNFDAFGHFMGFARSFAGDAMFDSERATQLFRWASDNQVSPGSLKKNFEYYLSNFESGHARVITKARGGFDQDKWIKAFKRKKV